MVDLQGAYDACARDCREHYENFPVASFLLPRRMRPHIAALYAFARAADDFADEGNRTAEERHRLLDCWRSRLREAVAGVTSTLQPPPAPGEPAHTREIFLALGVSIRRLQLPSVLLEDLLSAFRQDVTVTRYSTLSALFDYCRRSANPIGRLVLRIGGYTAPDLDAWSDSICTALQMANFWQDLGVDTRRGRMYPPASDCVRHGVTASALLGQHDAPNVRALVADLVGWARDLMHAGAPLVHAVPGRAGWELRLVVQGGLRSLEKIAAMDFATLTARPTVKALDAPVLLWRALWMRAPRVIVASRSA